MIITNYSEYNYYELNLYEIDNSRINCIITYFLRTNELVFKYYNININGNRIEGQIDYTYYNDSLNPINKGINCQANYPDELICFYMNKEKDIVKMDIKLIYNTYNVSIEFQAGKINQKYLPDGNIIIMSSLFKDKYKFYSPISTDSFSIYHIKQADFNFFHNFNNELKEQEIKGNPQNKIFTLAIFNNHNDGQPTNTPKKNIFISNSGSTVEFMENCGGINLCFKEVINIFILRFCEEIDNYKYDYSYLDTNKKSEKISNFFRIH